MRITKEEGLRMALALDTAISCMEDLDAPAVNGITKSLKQDSLIHLRELRSAALRANREAPQQDVPFNLINNSVEKAS
jgi:hypothetical protein